MLYNPNLKFTVMLLFQLKKNEHLNILNIKDLKILSVHKEMGGGNLWEVLDMFGSLKMVMISCMYTYPQIHHVVYMKYFYISIIHG